MTDPKNFIKGLNDRSLLAHIEKTLTRAVVDRKHQWRTVVMATSHPHADARILILRKYFHGKRIIRLYTDLRSPKVASLTKDPEATLLFWNYRSREQLRIRVKCTLQNQTEECKKIWKDIPSYGRGDYASPGNPGSPLHSTYQQDGETLSAEEAYKNFTLIDCEMLEMDYLRLDPENHQRVLFTWKETSWKTTRLTP